MHMPDQDPRVLAGEQRERELNAQQLAAGRTRPPSSNALASCWCCSPQPAGRGAIDEDRMPGPKTVRWSEQPRGGQRPEIKMLRVLGNNV